MVHPEEMLVGIRRIRIRIRSTLKFKKYILT